jgi:demethylmenaquinone methyltransferase/2-methoxy-6-polyprenyl-1,4-benzoquinol methylase
VSASPNAVSIEKYRAHAAAYDRSAQRTMPLRVRTVAGLALRRGDVVVDVGCGTGLSLPLLVQGVGDAGHVVGIEQSPEMMHFARTRVREQGWRNVTLIESPVEEAVLPARFDAILFNYTHDVLRTPAALANLFRHARPGARVAVAGIKFFPWWAAPLNLYVYLKNRPYNANPGGLSRPWRHLERYVPDLRVEPTQFGMGYIALGRLPLD